MEYEILEKIYQEYFNVEVVEEKGLNKHDLFAFVQEVFRYLEKSFD